MSGERSPSGDHGGSERPLIEAARAEASRIASATTAAVPLDAFPPPAPDSFAGYEIEGEVHRGGQAVVYRAVQAGTKRRVAIKVLREGPFADVRDRVRFEREVHILAQLSHPNIVTIHDSGAAAGYFFYVMDYIAGQPLDAFVTGRRRSPDEILRLFLKICEGVNAAHLQGVIHRDLKPANILVGPDGEPHILDFGLAKVGSGRAIGDLRSGVMSLSGQFIGSLPWASPEQVEGRPQRIDVRTDVYALGVILYQMLTGRFPYDVSGTMREVADSIVEAEPLRPSALRRDINDEVETIVLKCLQKGPERRYQSAGEVARDITHYLAGEPIEAKRDSGWYVLRKMLWRYKVPAAVGASFVVLIGASLVALSLLYMDNRAARHGAEELARIMGDLSLTFDADAVTDPFDPQVAGAGALERIELVANALEDTRVDAAFEAELRTTVGMAFHKLRRYAEAEHHLRRAVAIRQRILPATDPALADSLHNLGKALYYQDEFLEAERCYTQALEIRRLNDGETSLAVADSVNHLAACLMSQGRLREAEARFVHALDMRRRLLGDDDARVAAGVNNLAKCMQARGRYADALVLFQEALDRILGRGVNELFVVRGLRSVGTCQIALGRYDEARGTLEEAVERVTRLPGDQALQIARSRYLLAHCAYGLGDLAEAERLCRQARSDQQAAYPAGHTTVADSDALLAAILLERGEAAESRLALDDALATRRAVLGDGHPDVAALWCLEARLAFMEGRLEQAEERCRAALAVQTDPDKLVPTAPQVAETMAVLGMILIERGAPDLAEPWLRESVRTRAEAFGAGHWTTAESTSLLGACLGAAGRTAEARPLLRDAHAILHEQRGDRSGLTLAARDRLAGFVDGEAAPLGHEAPGGR